LARLISERSNGDFTLPATSIDWNAQDADCSAGWYVQSVSRLLFSKSFHVGGAISDMRVVLRGKELTNTDTLTNCVQPNDTLQLLFRLPGGTNGSDGNF